MPTADQRVPDDVLLRELHDRACIEDLLARWCDAADRLDLAEASAVFAPGAEIDSDGRRGSVELLVEELRATAEFHHLTHFLGGVVIDLDATSGTAEARSLVTIAARHPDPPRGVCDVWQQVRYRDGLRRVDGVWLIAQRTIATIWHRSDPIGADTVLEPPPGFVVGSRHAPSSPDDGQR